MAKLLVLPTVQSMEHPKGTMWVLQSALRLDKTLALRTVWPWALQMAIQSGWP